ncbi:MAG: hypothetical protein A3F35_01660 [Candidatus Woykebacteria bacterium RIFCSPHIGHO2_12_FULL_45_10]|uniref:Uncharacterized protein n=1 Tax=Candidatus Woykebacteria bacterium RIFCSPHIGHO2_12_FULL_45_10 TaxID=1802603 RepID=A0A1G1WRQ7_9BACT|nr:MAG: hypothetical protein A3F35_01660 [Candidatus Woykebacteria bacterium RIFCSPHIGHO2_12_FULL_45_10]
MNKVSANVRANPTQLLLDNWPFIASFIQDGERWFQGFTDFNEALERYEGIPVSNKTIYVVRALVPRPRRS